MLCAAPRRSDVIRLGLEHVIAGRLVYRQKKTGAEIDIPILPQLAAAIASLPEQRLFLETQFARAFTETGFYNWFTDKARRAGVPAAAASPKPDARHTKSCRSAAMRR
jgi:hypothetical protein